MAAFLLAHNCAVWAGGEHRPCSRGLGGGRSWRELGASFRGLACSRGWQGLLAGTVAGTGLCTWPLGRLGSLTTGWLSPRGGRSERDPGLPCVGDVVTWEVRPAARRPPGDRNPLLPAEAKPWRSTWPTKTNLALLENPVWISSCSTQVCAVFAFDRCLLVALGDRVPIHSQQRRATTRAPSMKEPRLAGRNRGARDPLREGRRAALWPLGGGASPAKRRAAPAGGPLAAGDTGFGRGRPTAPRGPTAPGRRRGAGPQLLCPRGVSSGAEAAQDHRPGAQKPPSPSGPPGVM